MQVNRTLLVTTVAVLAMGLACSSSTSSSHTISGTVTGASNVGVSLTGAQSATTTTDESGNFSFGGLADGSYAVTPTKASYTCSPSSQAVILKGADVQGLQFAAAAATHAISGKITGASNATVNLTSASSGVTISIRVDASGTFQFAGLPDGDYTVTAAASGNAFSPVSHAVTLAGADLSGKDFAATAVASTFTLSGSAAGLAGVRVTLAGTNSGTVFSDAAGHYSFSNLGSGGYVVTPSKSGYKFTPASLPALVNGADLAGQDFTALVARHTISGTVTGTTLPVTVALSGASSATATTDASGRYSFIDVVDGEYRVMPRRGGYVFSPASRALTLEENNVLSQDFAVASRSWSFVNPSPFSPSPGAIWGSGANDVWMLDPSGAGRVPGTMLHWDGTAWSYVPSISAQFSAIWGTGPNDVWAVGNGGVIAHWDGGSWTQVASGTTAPLATIWGSAPDDVWAAGSYASGTAASALLHWDGAAWTKVEVPGFTVAAGSYLTIARIWGSGPSDVWAAGTAYANELSVAAILHWDGSAWTRIAAGTANGLHAVWGAGPNDVWFGGAYGTLLHWDGTSISWTPSLETSTVRALWGSSGNDVWAVGYDGIVQRWGGTAWTTIASGTTSNIAAVWGSGPNDVWLSSSPRILHWDGTAFTNAVKTLTANQLYAVRGSSASDVWAVGASGLTAHFDGSAWMTVPSGSTANLQSVWAGSATNAWAVGQNGTTLHWDGAAWTPVASGTTQALMAVWGFAANDVWAVGGSGTILHWNGTEWQDRGFTDDGVTRATTLHLRSIWGSSANDIWAVSSNSTNLVFRWNGSGWSSVTTPATTFRYCVWGSGPNDVWAGGNSGVMHWDGTSWSAATSLGQWVQSIWSSGPNDVWAAPSGRALQHWDGTAWSAASMPNLSLNGLWGSGANDVWAVGRDGYVLRWN